MITINPNTYNGFDILCRVYENQSQSYWRSINRDENKQICVEVLFACKTFPDDDNSYYEQLDCNLYPEITFENSPQKIEIKLVKDE